MIIKKVLNNNLLLVESENGKEQIAMGKGLRFSYKVGERLRETDVEKIYMLKDEKNTQWGWRSSAPDPALLPAFVLPFPPPGLSDWLVRKPKSSAFRLLKPMRTALTRKKQPKSTPLSSKRNAKTFIISSLMKN